MAITVLPQYESAGGHIGRNLGEGLSEGLQQLAQIKMQHVMQRHQEQHQQNQISNFLKVAFPGADEATINMLKQTPMPILQKLLTGMQLQQYQKPEQQSMGMQQQQQPSFQDLLSQPGGSVNPMDSFSRLMMGFHPEQQQVPQMIQQPQPTPKYGIRGAYASKTPRLPAEMTENQKKQLDFKERSLAYRKERSTEKKELMPKIVDAFLKKSGNDPVKAKELARLAGYKV
jgi:hypothetical protein